MLLYQILAFTIHRQIQIQKKATKVKISSPTQNKEF